MKSVPNENAQKTTCSIVSYVEHWKFKYQRFFGDSSDIYIVGEV